MHISIKKNTTVPVPVGTWYGKLIRSLYQEKRWLYEKGIVRLTKGSCETNKGKLWDKQREAVRLTKGSCETNKGKLWDNTRAVDPRSFFADSDPAVFFNADPDADPGLKLWGEGDI